MFAVRINTTDAMAAINGSIASALRTFDDAINTVTMLTEGAQYILNTNYGELLVEFVYDPLSEEIPPRILYAKVFTLREDFIDLGRMAEQSFRVDPVPDP